MQYLHREQDTDLEILDYLVAAYLEQSRKLRGARRGYRDWMMKPTTENFEVFKNLMEKLQ